MKRVMGPPGTAPLLLLFAFAIWLLWWPAPAGASVCRGDNHCCTGFQSADAVFSGRLIGATERERKYRVTRSWRGIDTPSVWVTKGNEEELMVPLFREYFVAAYLRGGSGGVSEFGFAPDSESGQTVGVLAPMAIVNHAGTHPGDDARLSPANCGWPVRMDMRDLATARFVATQPQLELTDRAPWPSPIYLLSRPWFILFMPPWVMVLAGLVLLAGLTLGGRN